MKQKEKAEQSKNRIVQAAICEFAASGYKDCTISNLCQRHQLSKGIVFYHFKTKEDIFLSCVERCCKTMEAEVGAQLRDIHGSPEENLVSCHRAVFNFYQRCPQMQKVLYIAQENPPRHLEAKIKVLFAQMEAQIKEFVAKNIRQLPLRPGIEASMVLQTMEDFLNYINVRNKKKFNENYSEIVEIAENRQKEFEFLIAILLHGVVQ